MSRDNDLPFARGKTYFGSGTPVTTAGDSSYEFEGREYEVEDIDFTPGSTYGKRRSGEKITLRVVRNLNPGTGTDGIILGKRLVHFKTGSQGKEVDGYARLIYDHAAVSDEFLPSTGVPYGDLFYVVVAGPSLVWTPEAATGADMTQDKVIYAVTNTTAGATTSNSTASAGRFFCITAASLDNFTGVTAQSLATNWIGRMMSSATSGETATSKMVRIRRW